MSRTTCFTRSKRGPLIRWDLYRGGSVWEVVDVKAGRSYKLTRRAIGPVRETIDALSESAPRAQEHLALAFSRLAGRNPDPSAAYREAVRAVEAAAKSTITPSDGIATLGKMVAALRDKPEKWTTTVGNVATVPSDDGGRSQRAGRPPRHGRRVAVPLHVSAEAADAAFHMSLTQVRPFAGDHVVRIATT